MKYISAIAVALALSAGSTFAAGSASAADLPSMKAPVYVPPPPPPPMWTGFYAGLNAGYGWGATSNANTISLPLFDGVAAQANALDPLRQIAGTGLISGNTALANSGVANVNQGGFIGGGQIGYNYQWSPRIVLGLEADFQGSTISGGGSYSGASQDSISWKDPYIPGLSPCVTNGCTFTRSAIGVGQVNAGVDWMGTVRGRLGYLVTPTTLIYATGGLAYGGVHATATHAGVIPASLAGANDAQFPTPYPYSQFNGNYLFPMLPGTGSYSSTQVGWIGGAGVEWMFAPNWSLKVEGLYYDLGGGNIYSSPVALLSPLTVNLGGIHAAAGQLLLANAPVTHVKFDGVIARAGINYHFNWGAPAPVLAKY
ncbi:MAG: outer membrane beta-barrel protein [Methylocystis sp.]